MKGKTIILVGCGAKKASSACQAKDMYQGDLFKKALAYAYKLRPDAIHILSAKYHLLDLTDIIAPYNETLNNKKVHDIKIWSDIVLNELKARGYDLQNDKFIFLTGKNYYRYLLHELPLHELPYYGLKGIGYILHYLNNQLSH